MSPKGTHMVYFETEGRAYAIRADELCAVAPRCLAKAYPGLPDGIAAVACWDGKIFPVVDVRGSQNDLPADFGGGTFLFSGSDGADPIALFVPGSVRVFLACETTAAQNGTAPRTGFTTPVARVRDADGREAVQLQLNGFAVQTGGESLAA